MMPLLFVIAGFALQNAQAEQPTPPDFKTIESGVNTLFAEKAKWNFLRMQLAEKLDGAQTFTNNVGAVMNNYAPWIVGLELLMLIGWKAFDYKCHISRADNGTNGSPSWGEAISEFIAKKLLFEGEEGGREYCYKIHKNLTRLALLEFITYGVCKRGGAYLEDKASLSFQALTEFVQQWHMHKTLTPVALHALFDDYANDLKAHGELTTLDKNGARKVVEALLAMAVMAETIK